MPQSKISGRDTTEVTVPSEGAEFRGDGWPPDLRPPPPISSSEQPVFDDWLRQAREVIDVQRRLCLGALDECRSRLHHLHSMPGAFQPEEFVVTTDAAIETARALGFLEGVAATTDRLSPGGEREQAATDVANLLSELPHERARLARAVTASVLGSLCTLVLELEVTERVAHHEPSALPDALRSMHDHLVDAAEDLRRTPLVLEALPYPAIGLADSLREVCNRYRGIMRVTRATRDAHADPHPEQYVPLMWVLGELLHQFHLAAASDVHVALVMGGDRLRLEVGATGCRAGIPEATLAACRLRCGSALEEITQEVSPELVHVAASVRATTGRDGANLNPADQPDAEPG